MTEMPVTAYPTEAPTAAGAIAETAQPTGQAPTQAAQGTATAFVEQRQLDLEWPARMRLGDSDTVRLRLVPDGDNYTIEAEFPEHDIQSQPLSVPRPDGYALSAAANLNGVGFDLSPQGEQAYALPAGKAVVWQWTIAPRAPGEQRLSLQLVLRWALGPSVQGQAGEAVAFTRGLDVQVTSFLGMNSRQSLFLGIFGLVFGGGLSLGAFFWRPRSRVAPLHERLHPTVSAWKLPRVFTWAPMKSACCAGCSTPTTA